MVARIWPKGDWQPMKYRGQPAKAYRSSRSGGLQLSVAVVAGLCVAGLGLFGSKSLWLAASEPVRAAEVGPNPSLDTGAIMSVPDEGNNCRQILFNNRSGQFTDNGYVSCEQLSGWMATASLQRFPSRRLRDISNSFFPR